MIWSLAAVAALVLAGGAGLYLAIRHNGPAVLSAVDRIAGDPNAASLRAVVSTGAHPQQKLIVWAPAERDPADPPLPVLVFVHGGSWRSGDPEDYGFVARALAPEGFVVVLAGYRLGAEGTYPAMLEDTARVIAWTHEQITAHGGDPARIVLAGHSAGAYNAVMVALEEQWLGRRGLPADAIAGVIGLSGPYDFAPFTSESTLAAFGHVAQPAATQPMEHVRANAPAMLLIHGERDTLVKPRNTRALAAALSAAGAEAETVFHPEMEHNDPLIALAAPWRKRRDIALRIAEFARAATQKHQTSVPVKPEAR